MASLRFADLQSRPTEFLEGVDHILIYEHGGCLLSTPWGPARSS